MIICKNNWTIISINLFNLGVLRFEEHLWIPLSLTLVLVRMESLLYKLKDTLVHITTVCITISHITIVRHKF